MKTVVGLYDELTNAHDTVNDLVTAGFDRNNISLVSGDRDNSYATGTETEMTTDTTTANAMAGALTGGAIGGMAGMLVGLGALAIPGLGPVIAAGPIVAGLTGAGIGAAAGGLLGALIGWGIPEEHATYYAEGVRRGSTLVALKVDESQVEEAVEIMDRHNPVDIERRSEYWRASGWTGYDPHASGYTSDQIASERENYNSYPYDDYTTFSPTFQRHYETSFADRGHDYNWYEPAYRYGYDLALTDRYRDYDEWDEIEAEARGGWSRTEHAVNGTWEEFKDSVRHAWEEVKDALDMDDDDDGVMDITEDDTDTANDNYVGSSSWRGARVHSDSYATDNNGGSYNTDDHHFRQHYDTYFTNSRYGYNEYLPAYRYGYDLANYAPYRGRGWNEIEPEVHKRWEETNQGTWEDVKDAVRHGWNQVKEAVS
ncbi:MAG: hypothetical protein KA314_17170 [Chloroflexi bacterium]|nr:hypothetical protein [Chloroflexota bacterium]MBP8057565.1 hypothetical protein [Chloroflexota bacterium]